MPARTTLRASPPPPLPCTAAAPVAIAKGCLPFLPCRKICTDGKLDKPASLISLPLARHPSHLQTQRVLSHQHHCPCAPSSLPSLSSRSPTTCCAQAIKYASSSSLAVIRRGDGSKWLALAYQASDTAYEGSRGQHIRFALSKDGGETFAPSRAVMWGAAPLWSPSLHHDAGEGMEVVRPVSSRQRPSAAAQQGGQTAWHRQQHWSSVGWGCRLGARVHAACPITPDVCLPAPFCAAATNRLFLFYSESRKSLSPGGDIKVGPSRGPAGRHSGQVQ